MELSLHVYSRYLSKKIIWMSCCRLLDSLLSPHVVRMSVHRFVVVVSAQGHPYSVLCLQKTHLRITERPLFKNCQMSMWWWLLIHRVGCLWAPFETQAMFQGEQGLSVSTKHRAIHPCTPHSTHVLRTPPHPSPLPRLGKHPELFP
jgi:hypothetical protein